MNTRIVVLFSLVIFLSACAPDPRQEAQAYQTRIQADQYAADQIQTRNQQQAQFSLDLMRQKATEQARVDAINRMLYWSSLFGAIAISISLAASTIGFSWAAIGVGKYTARKAEVIANLIPLNATTRQFPLFLQYISKGKYSLTNMNNGQTLLLDTRNEPDRQMISAASMVQVAGVIASEARKSKDPAGLAMMNPPAIDAQDNGLEVGLNLFRASSIWKEHDDE